MMREPLEMKTLTWLVTGLLSPIAIVIDLATQEVLASNASLSTACGIKIYGAE